MARGGFLLLAVRCCAISAAAAAAVTASHRRKNAHMRTASPPPPRNRATDNVKYWNNAVAGVCWVGSCGCVCVFFPQLGLLSHNNNDTRRKQSRSATVAAICEVVRSCVGVCPCVCVCVVFVPVYFGPGELSTRNRCVQRVCVRANVVHVIEWQIDSPVGRPLRLHMQMFANY